jgi:UDP-hydrolysing UDP-N-acetyl-D-glucosamine 2-epimerase
MGIKRMQIACITGSRADWNGLGMVAMALHDAEHDIRVIATGQHLEGAGTTDLIAADGLNYSVAPLYRTKDRPIDIAEAAGAAVTVMGRALDSLKPDLVVLCGDRYESLSAATAASMLRVPIAHIAGGDVTEGSLDDKYRNAITMQADYHFPTNEWSAQRLTDKMGIDGARVHQCGSPALDRIRVTPLVSKEQLFGQWSVEPKRILVSFHPATNEAEPTRGCIEMLAACKALDDEIKPAHYLWLLLGSNADAGGREIDRLMLIFKSRCGDRSTFVANLPPQLYYSALAYCDLQIGNSSAGLYEAPSFGIPVVNIGNRQTGRLAAANVRTCAPTREAILHTMNLQLAEGRKPCANPYGDGHSAARIAKIIEEWHG